MFFALIWKVVRNGWLRTNCFCTWVKPNWSCLGRNVKLNKYNDFSIVLSVGQTIRTKQSVVYLGLEFTQYLDSRLKCLYRQVNFGQKDDLLNSCNTPIWLFYHIMAVIQSIMLEDYVLKTKLLGLSMIRILCIILTTRISNPWAF